MFPLPMGHCAAVPCGKHACATTQLPVQVNLESQAQVCLPNSPVDADEGPIFMYEKFFSRETRGDRTCSLGDFFSFFQNV